MSLPISCTTSDNYTASATFTVRGTNQLNLTVLGGTAYYQIAQGMADAWSPEVPLAAGFYSLDRPGLYGVRFRSAAAGVPATVTGEALF